jgi:hypothetical protein
MVGGGSACAWVCLGAVVVGRRRLGVGVGGDSLRLYLLIVRVALVVGARPQIIKSAPIIQGGG